MSDDPPARPRERPGADARWAEPSASAPPPGGRSAEEPTLEQEDRPPPPVPARARRGAPAGSWIGLALAVACGFLLGALVVTTVGGSDTTQTVTRSQTITAPGASPQDPTVITKTLVPPLIGETLDVAKQRTDRAKFLLEVDSGGGLFGVQVDENWEVVAQRPGPGELIEQGSTVHVDIERR